MRFFGLHNNIIDYLQDSMYRSILQHYVKISKLHTSKTVVWVPNSDVYI